MVFYRTGFTPPPPSPSSSALAPLSSPTPAPGTAPYSSASPSPHPQACPAPPSGQARGQAFSPPPSPPSGPRSMIQSAVLSLRRHGLQLEHAAMFRGLGHVAAAKREQDGFEPASVGDRHGRRPAFAAVMKVDFDLGGVSAFVNKPNAFARLWLQCGVSAACRDRDWPRAPRRQQSRARI